MGRFAEWIDRRLKLLRIRSQQELSEISGVSSRTISRILTTGKLEGAERSTRVWLARTLKVSLRELEDLDAGKIKDIPDSRIIEWDHCNTLASAQNVNAPKLVPVGDVKLGVPVLGRVAAGGMVESFEDFDSDGGLRLPVRIDNASGAYALEIAGDSMIPNYQPGEYVILRNIPPEEVRDGEDVMIQLDGNGDGKAAFKRVYIIAPGRLKLVSLNAKYGPIDVDAEKVTRVGRLLGKFTPPALVRGT